MSRLGRNRQVKTKKMTEILGQSKITRSGQVTLSTKVREMLGVNIGEWVVFKKEGKRLVILPAEIKLKAAS